jgi:hypothetical protein
MSKLLVTMGCSWTYGVCSGYTPGMSRLDLEKISCNDSLCNQMSFRGLLSKKYNLINKNFSTGGSSNQRQFRLAKEFFSSEEFLELQRKFDDIIVLWGITSTARNEMWSLESNDLVNFFYSDTKLNLAKSLVQFNYNHEQEVAQLATEMRHWNIFFKNLNIKNLWFDTFNHHNYSIPGPRINKFKKEYETHRGPDWPSWEDFSKNQFKVDEVVRKEIMDRNRWGWAELFPQTIANLMFASQTPRDLLSMLAINNGCLKIDSNYHLSGWKIDTNRVKYLVDCGMLNPYSHHPTQQGHQQIANIMAEYIEEFL